MENFAEKLERMLDEKLAPIMTDLETIKKDILQIKVNLLLTDAIFDSIENV